MNKESLKKAICELIDQDQGEFVSLLQEKLIEGKTPFFPDNYEEYWTYRTSGDYTTPWQENIGKDVLIGLGICTETKEEIDSLVEKYKTKGKILRRLYELNGAWIADKNNYTQSKWFLRLESNDRIETFQTRNMYSKHAAKSIEVIESLFEEFGKKAVMFAFTEIEI